MIRTITSHESCRSLQINSNPEDQDESFGSHLVFEGAVIEITMLGASMHELCDCSIGNR